MAIRIGMGTSELIIDNNPLLEENANKLDKKKDKKDKKDKTVENEYDTTDILIK